MTESALEHEKSEKAAVSFDVATDKRLHTQNLHYIFKNLFSHLSFNVGDISS